MLVDREDGWTNVATGMGAPGYDKTMHTQFLGRDRIADSVLTNLFRDDWVIGRACGRVPLEMLREGISLSVGDADPDIATDISMALGKLEAVPKLIEALTWERLYGGAAIWMGFDDGQRRADSQARPVREDTLRKLLWLRVVDRRQLRAVETERDPLSAQYGQPSVYEVTHHDTTLGEQHSTRIHASRLLVFPGRLVPTDVRATWDGWGPSVVQDMWEVLQRHVTAWQSAGYMVGDASYSTLKIANLLQLLDREGGVEAVKRRAQAVALSRSIARTVIIGDTEEYSREAPNFGQLPAMLDRFMFELAAALEMPVTLLFGRSPAGMNATGESDLTQWYNRVKAAQTYHLAPRIERLVSLLVRAKEGPTAGVEPDEWQVQFPALSQPTDLEAAELRLKQAQTDKLYVDMGAVLPEEVALSRFRPEGWTHETVIDLEARKEIAEAELHRATETAGEPDPEPMLPDSDEEEAA